MTGEIRVLGPVHVAGAAGPIRLPVKQRRLLAALVIATPAARSADALIDIVWADGPPASAQGVLQVYVSQLRKALAGVAGIERHGAGYALVVDARALDVARFEQLLREARGAAAEENPGLAASLLRRARSLWHGRAYDEFADEEWARTEVERLDALRLDCLDELFAAELSIGRHAEVMSDLQLAAADAPLRERLQEQAIVALYRCGRQAEALDLYAGVRARLREELGVDPSPRLQELYQRVLRHDASLEPSTEPTPPHSLPVPTTALLGRERELAEVHDLLSVQRVRLLVLTGAGGSGKTRLAIEAAQRAATSFANGVVFVDLAPVRDPELVPAAIADALGVGQTTANLVEAVGSALQSRELLLVVDNAEHVRDAAPRYTELLSRASRLAILVTSRVVLHLTGEHVYAVDPLTADSAATLFLQRAREREPRLALSGDDDHAIRSICAHLDGLPLAVELAAARAGMLTPAELLSRLESRLPIPAGGLRDLPARQQTLETTVAWSYGLLDADEKQALRRLAVFSGGCTLEAAEQVCATTLDRLGALLDASLLRRTISNGQSRYAMLETVREQALHLLEASAQSVAARDAHAHYFVDMAERAYADRLQRSADWLPRLEADHGNLSAAMDWLAETDSGQALRLAGALGWFWGYRGHLVEGRRRLTEALSRAPDANVYRARALAMGAQLLNVQGDLAAARAWGEEAATLATELDDPETAAPALVILGTICTHQGELSRARQLHEQALTHAERIPGTALAVRALAGICYVLVCGGQTDLAECSARDLLARGQAERNEVTELQALHYLGDCALQRGDCVTAERHYRDALAIAWRLGHSNQAETEVVGLAMALAGQSRAREALRLAASVTAHRAAEDVRPSVPFWEQLQRHYLGQARAELGQQAAHDAWQQGQTLPIHELVNETLTVPAHATRSPTA